MEENKLKDVTDKVKECAEAPENFLGESEKARKLELVEKARARAKSAPPAKRQRAVAITRTT